jgi:Tol biopolymer transport system component
MKSKWYGVKTIGWATPTIYPCWCAKHILLLALMLKLFSADDVVCKAQVQNSQKPRLVPSPRVELKLEEIPFKIIYEAYREINGKKNWELYLINADGSNPVNLTNTPDVDEMYPHVSPDATKICFVVDEGIGRDKVRSVYYMNIDGTQRIKVAENARQPCWSFDSKSIAYLKSEYERYSTKEYATSELLIYDLQSRLHRQHPNKELHHLYAICWSPYGKWFVAAVEGGMGYSDTILAFEYDGTKVFDLAKWGVKGCRPDLSLDGSNMVWGETDWNLCIGDIDLMSNELTVSNIRELVRCSRKNKVYHVDLSPDGRYIAFSYGPFRGGQQVGGMAPGWDICIGDMSGKWVKVTTDGNHNKEPDWVPIQSVIGKQN